MRQTRAFFLLLFIIVQYGLSSQENCDELHKIFSSDYAKNIRSLHATNPQKADSIYKTYKIKYENLDCHTYTVMSKFITTYAHLLYHALKDYQRDNEFLEFYREKFRESNDSLFVMINNNIALHALYRNNYPKMKTYLVEANEVAEAKLDPTFGESIRTTSNLALYYDWLNMENQCIKIYQKNLDLISSKKITDINFRYETYKEMYGFHLELENSLQSKVYLDSLYAIIQTLEPPKKEKMMVNYYELLLRYHNHFGPNDAAVNLYKSKLYSKPDNLDYDHIMLYLPLLAETGQLTRMKNQLDTLQGLFDKRDEAAYHFYRIRKLRYDIMYFKAIGDHAAINEALQKIVAAYNNNLNNIIYTSEYDQMKTLALLSEIATLTINLAYDKNDSPRNKLLYDIQCNLKSITNQYLKNKNELIYNSKDGELIKLFEKQKSLVNKLENAESSSRQILTDSIKTINESLHQKYLMNNSTIQYVNHKEIMSRLDGHTLYIDFFEIYLLQKKYMYAFMISKGNVNVIKIDNYENAYTYLLNSNSNYINNKAANAALYKILLAPLIPFLQSYDHLYITVDGIYNNVALEILSSNGKLDDAPLAHKSISFVSNGASVLNLLSGENRSTSLINMLVIGDIDYQCKSEKNTNDGGNLQSEGSLKQLIGSAIEVNDLNTLAVQYNVPYSKLSKCNATIENFSLSAQHPLLHNHLHLSTHGFYNASLGYDNHISERMRSGLVMSISSDNRQMLSALEISNLNLFHIQHCFLSACNTGLGLYTPGQGNFSVAQAFKIAGVQYVIATLWEIPDLITAEFVNHYYSHYFTTKDAAMSMQYAKEKLKNKYPPKAWAAFRLMQ